MMVLEIKKVGYLLLKAGNPSEKLLNEIRHIMYSLCRAKEITKAVYNNIVNSVKL